MNFKDKEEEVSSNLSYIRTGINDVTIKEIYHQPIGANVKEGQKPENVTIEKGVFVLESKEGGTFNYDVLKPKDVDQEVKMLKRLLHFLSKTGKSSDVEAIKTKLQSLPDMDFATLIKTLAKGFTGKSVRVKFVGSYPDKKYTSIPNYLSGWAECIDVNPTQLKYDEATEGLAKKDSSKVEKSSTANDDDFPF